MEDNRRPIPSGPPSRKPKGNSLERKITGGSSEPIREDERNAKYWDENGFLLTPVPIFSESRDKKERKAETPRKYPNKRLFPESIEAPCPQTPNIKRTSKKEFMEMIDRQKDSVRRKNELTSESVLPMPAKKVDKEKIKEGDLRRSIPKHRPLQDETQSDTHKIDLPKFQQKYQAHLLNSFIQRESLTLEAEQSTSCECTHNPTFHTSQSEREAMAKRAKTRKEKKCIEKPKAPREEEEPKVESFANPIPEQTAQILELLIGRKPFK